MENKTNVWEMFKKAEDKKQFLIKVAAAAEAPIKTLLPKLSVVRQSSTVMEIKDGFPAYFPRHPNVNDAVGILNDHSAGKALIKGDTILGLDVEICVQSPLTKNTIDCIDTILAEKLAAEENVLYQRLVVAVNAVKGVTERCLFGIRRHPRSYTSNRRALSTYPHSF